MSPRATLSGGGPTADPYVPGHGDLRYGVDSYDLALTYKALSNHLSGHAVLAVTVRASTAELVLDLHHLKVVKLALSGAPLAHWRHRAGRVVLTLARPVDAGTHLTVTVTYQGVPRTVRGPDGEAGWEELEDGVIVASQPHGAPSWFPCNDRPSDKAVYRLRVTAPTAYTVVGNGALLQRIAAASKVTWVFAETEPMAPYLATLQIGVYARRQLGESTAGVPVLVAHPPRLTRAVDTAFARQVEMVDLFTRLFGPYPFPTYTVVVTDDRLEIPLESQALSTFGSNFARTDWQSQRLIAHELSHQWFGNSVTTTEWRDIWLHEGFACYAEWLWSPQSGGPTTHQRALAHWRLIAGQPQDLILGEPGPRDLFDDRVYKRGALLLHALRLLLGDEVFFALLQSWLAEHRYGSVTSAQFVAAAQAVTERDLSDFFKRWLYQPGLPALPPSG